MTGPDGRPPRPAPSDDGERVRACLACGALMPFEEVICPACGHEEAAHPASPGERVIACPACLEFLSASLLFCPACGAEIAAVGSAPPAPAAVPEPRAGAAPVLATTLALVAPLIAVAALGQLVFGALPGLLD
jgi:RNA polymerase subunit RPABC4/transcription elongation factor Spt4